MGVTFDYQLTPQELQQDLTAKIDALAANPDRGAGYAGLKTLAEQMAARVKRNEGAVAEKTSHTQRNVSLAKFAGFYYTPLSLALGTMLIWAGTNGLGAAITILGYVATGLSLALPAACAHDIKNYRKTLADLSASTTAKNNVLRPLLERAIKLTADLAISLRPDEIIRSSAAGRLMQDKGMVARVFNAYGAVVPTPAPTSPLVSQPYTPPAGYKHGDVAAKGI